MRPFHIFAALVVIGVGVASWATLGMAGPKDPSRPGATPTPMPKPRPADDLFDVPSPPSQRRPIIREVEPQPAPVRVLDAVDVPEIPTAPKPLPIKPIAPKELSPAVIKPTVFIPNPDVAEPPKVLPATASGAIIRQEPAISLEWHGQPTLQVNAPADYTLVARNTSATTLQKVIVQVKVPTGVKITGTEPKADGTDSVLLWDLGTLTERQEKSVKISMVPPGKGEMNCQAWVTFTGSATMKVQVREARLAVAAKAAEKVAIGDLTTVVFQVSNTGDHTADGVKLAISLGAGLECERGPKVVIDLESLPAGETREVKVPCVARAAGPQLCEGTVDGKGGLKAASSATVNIVQPKLEVQLIGPKLRYLDRKAVYVVKVSNPGDAPASGVSVSHLVPAGFKYLSADEDGKFDSASKNISWDVGVIPAGEYKELRCELMAIGAGDFAHKVAANGDRGLRAENRLETKIEGVSAVAMEVTDSDDPLEVGTDTTYEIRIANTGSKDETDVRVVCALPAQLKLKGARAPGNFEMVGNDLVFESLPKLPAKTEVTYKVTVTAIAKGDARFKVTLTAAGLSEPVVKQESTRIYSD
jgi:hypothetical protein